MPQYLETLFSVNFTVLKKNKDFSSNLFTFATFFRCIFLASNYMKQMDVLQGAFEAKLKISW